MSNYVLDASALLALLNDEGSNTRVEAILGEAVVSAVNACETLGKLIDAGVPERDARASLELLNLEVIPFDAEMAYTAACLRPQSRRLGLSLGDRCCLAAWNCPPKHGRDDGTRLVETENRRERRGRPMSWRVRQAAWRFRSVFVS